MTNKTYEPNDFYQINRWSKGYFEADANGDLCVLPEQNSDGARIAIKNVLQEMRVKNIELPAVIRFHDILHSRVKDINQSFITHINEYEYQGSYSTIYPIKVNQMREVVEEILEAGEEFKLGLEAGSKPELLAVLAMNENLDCLTILNGYKDEEYLKLAMLGRKLSRQMIVVVEKFSELPKLIKVSKEMNVRPLIGIRGKISVKGSGKWSDSGGDKAKFGLTISEILGVIEILEEENMLDCLELFHFHIGSQVTQIQSVKDAVAEGARIYSLLVKKGISLKYFDVGGGLGVDYEGSKSTSSSSSMNYSTDEYVSDVVYGLKQICDTEGVPHPNILSESGRAITAHHSCIITNVIGEIDPFRHRFDNTVYKTDHILVKNMRESLEEITPENFQEIYNDAVAIKTDALSGFKLGVLSLEERAKIETLFGKICTRIKEFVNKAEDIPEDLLGFKDDIAKQYLCNFSIFQSLPDVWAIQQILPIVPIHRLNEKPTEDCTLVDITCDSDGKIDNFIENDGTSGSLKLHKLKKDEDYYIGFFLTGAYQDVMGDMHNLFGRLNEVHVYCDDDDPEDFYIEEIIKGSTGSKVLGTMQYNDTHMAMTIKKKLDREVKSGRLQPKESVRLTDFYEDCLSSYTYLK
jgi:arginine decarboxylase